MLPQTLTITSGAPGVEGSAVCVSEREQDTLTVASFLHSPCCSPPQDWRIAEAGTPQPTPFKFLMSLSHTHPAQKVAVCHYLPGWPQKSQAGNLSSLSLSNSEPLPKGKGILMFTDAPAKLSHVHFGL